MESWRIILHGRICVQYRRKDFVINVNQLQRLLRQGVSTERLKQVHAPIGLDIGALTPEEIAVSIMSEIIMVRRGGTGASLQMDDWFVDRAASIVERKVEV